MATIKVCDNNNFRHDLAIAIVDECNPGYHGQGYHYADPLKGEIYYKEKNAAWNPWPSEAFVIPVRQLVAPYNYSDQIDWNLTEIPTEEMINAYVKELAIKLVSVRLTIESIQKNAIVTLKRIPKTRTLALEPPRRAWEPPISIDKSEVINFARNYSQEWKKIIDFEEENSREEAIAFAKSEIFDEIEIDWEEF